MNIFIISLGIQMIPLPIIPMSYEQRINVIPFPFPIVKRPIKLVINKPSSTKPPIKLVITKPSSSSTIKPFPLYQTPLLFNIPSPHTCYILKSISYNRIYIGYTVDFARRIRQHDGELVGGAKRTKRWRPWRPVCVIQGFYESSSALRFEYRLQHPNKRKPAKTDPLKFVMQNLLTLINYGDGSLARDNKMPWPLLNIKWYITGWNINHPRVINDI